ncbi:MAG: CotH kinase family protein [Clostridiales bacterium]|nr:CotH kinase family protein [Clostridiales bacterium]
MLLKIVKIILCALIILSCAFGGFSAVYAADAGITEFSVNPYGGKKESLDTINWYKNEEGYYLFLPSDISLGKLTVYFTASDEVYVGKTPLKNGEVTSAFKDGGDYTLSCGDKKYSLSVYKGANIPAMFIETESRSSDFINANKENREKANIRIYEGGKMTVDKPLKHIKGRGNTFNEYVDGQKSYNIKFEEKVSLFSMDKAKKWSLIGIEPSDQLRNAFAYDMARKMGLDNTSEYKNVDLYLNGDYIGCYLVCESVEIGKGRVDIADLENENEDANEGTDIENDCLPGGNGRNDVYRVGSKRWIDIPNDPDDITGGYLLEVDFFDRYLEEASGFISGNGTPIVVKSPEYASKAEVKYISDYWQKAEDAVYSDDGYNKEGKHYSEYFDLDSLVKMYILEEFTKDEDVGCSSCYFYKDKGGKIFAGPVWDFDSGFGLKTGFGQLQGERTDTWYANLLFRDDGEKDSGMTIKKVQNIFAALFMKDDFREAVRAFWYKNADNWFGEETISSCNALCKTLEQSAQMCYIRWDYVGKDKSLSPTEQFYADVKEITDFISERKSALDQGFSKYAAYVRYDLKKNVDDNLYEERMFFGFDDMNLPSYTGKDRKNGKEYVIVGWKAKIDGKTETFKPGDLVTLSAGMNVFHAVWKKNIPIKLIIAIAFLLIIVGLFVASVEKQKRDKKKAKAKAKANSNSKKKRR